MGKILFYAFVICITAGMVLSATGLLGRRVAAADANYITLSAYYAVPGSGITVYGHSFSPGETVVVSTMNLKKTAIAGPSGDFTTQSFVIPFDAAHSTQAVTALGNKGHQSAATLSVGTFYPVVDPSSYYVVPNGTVSFNGKNFAPQENIVVKNNGSAVATAQAGRTGNFTIAGLSVPAQAGNQTYIFSGQKSGASYPVTIHVSGTKSIVVLSNYYGYSGSLLHIAGRFFGAGEKVTVSMGNILLGQAKADSSGSFTLTSPVPNFPASSIQTIIAAGDIPGHAATARYTIAWNNQTTILSQQFNYHPVFSVVSYRW